MTSDLHALSELQRDALREVANIGAGHAATALSLMTGTKVMVSVPTVTIAALDALAPSVAPWGRPIAVVPMAMSGDLTGHTILAFPLDTAHRLASIMLRREALYATDVLTEVEASVITEAANMLAGAYLTALSEFLHMTLLLSPPTISVGGARETLSAAAERCGYSGGVVFCVETQFTIGHVGEGLPGYFLLLPDAPSLGAILSALSVA